MLSFRDLLTTAGIPLPRTRLLRHQEPAAKKGRSVYELWRDNRAEFERYQQEQGTASHKLLRNADYWASFVVTPSAETLFVGIYRATYVGPSKTDTFWSTTGDRAAAGTIHIYHVVRETALSEYEGRLVIEWGAGKRAWVQLSQQAKPIIELRREFKEPEFPGYLGVVESLSRVGSLPASWVEALKAARGVYVLTCPRTKELYIGSAYGASGFWGRWSEYARDGHGGNIQLKSRHSSDYQVAILEVAGTSASDEDVIRMEAAWKRKLQTREMGLNSN